jgi:type IV pilus assembly protein PilA
MFSELRRRAEEDQGFSLIELLVVILIICILAAIAIPSFLSQTSKADDASAKSQARTALTAAETLGTDNNGAYNAPTAVSVAGLQGVESTLKDSSGATLVGAGPDASTAPITPTSVSGDSASNSYYVESRAAGSTDRFEIVRHSDGTVERRCTPQGNGACPSTGNW